MRATVPQVAESARAAARLGPADALVVCFERLDEPHRGDDIVRCVALPGNAPGLSIGADGELGWHRRSTDHCLVVVSTDHELALWRPAGSVAIRLCREGRSLDLPEEKVVIAVDQDEIVVGSARLRIHHHGPARRIHPPFRVRMARHARTALLASSIGASATAAASVAAGCSRTEDAGATAVAPESASAMVASSATAGADAGVDGGSTPPLPTDAGLDGGADGGGAKDAGADAGTTPKPTGSSKPPKTGKPPIQVRPRPPVYFE